LNLACCNGLSGPVSNAHEAIITGSILALELMIKTKQEQNMNSLVKMINSMEVREEDETFRNAVDYLFGELAEKDPEHFAVRQYEKYRLAAGVVSCKGRFNQRPIQQEVKRLRHKRTDTISPRISLLV